MKYVKIHYFTDCKTMDEVKKAYRKLAVELHPDKGGDEEKFKALGLEYEFVCKKLAAGEKVTAEEQENSILDAEAYKKAIDAIANLEGLIIEIVGTWIWVTGETRTHKDVLKAAGYMWAKAKIAWYFRTEAHRSFNRRKMSLDEIRERHGSQRYNGNGYEKYLKAS